MQTTPFNSLDSIFLNLDCREEPWSVQLEVRVPGTVDPGKLTEAIRLTTARHPIARARLKTVKGHHGSYAWEIPDVAEQIPLEVVDASAPGALEAARARLQSHQVPLASSPPFAAMLARHPEGDYIMLNLSHVAGDGLSAFRLMTSIARHYAGAEDPVPDFDPLEKRHLGKLAGSRGLAQRAQRASLLAEHLWKSRTPPVRVKTRNVPDGEAPGYGFLSLAFSEEETAQIMARREKPATINDMLLAGLILTVREWNHREGGEEGRASIMMPVNLRPKDWWFEVVTNFSSYIPVSLTPDQQTDFVTAMRAVCALTTRLKEEGGASTLIDLLEGLDGLRLPDFIKRQLRAAVPAFERTSIDTAVLSNLGRMPQPLDFGEAGETQEIWFSPPGMMPLGISVGAASMLNKLFLTLRYRKAQFDAAAAEEFAALYRSILLG
ncbi:MAG: condensation domain-containing protein [Pseudomonadota bacterium]|nr:condensation domain-containing protein [Pseudomonadota bacterium]